MRTTLALDDELLAKAQNLTGLRVKSALVREAFNALVQRESALRLARLGASAPDVEVPHRRRSEPRSHLTRPSDQSKFKPACAPSSTH